MDIDPDFAMFNLWQQGQPRRGFQTANIPMVTQFHCYQDYQTIQQVRFVHYFRTGIPGMIYALIWGTHGADWLSSLVHSGLLAFLAMYGDIPAASLWRCGANP